MRHIPWWHCAVFLLVFVSLLALLVLVADSDALAWVLR